MNAIMKVLELEESASRALRELIAEKNEVDSQLRETRVKLLNFQELLRTARQEVGIYREFLSGIDDLRFFKKARPGYQDEYCSFGGELQLTLRGNSLQLDRWLDLAQSRFRR